MTDHLKAPQAVAWGDLAEDFAFTKGQLERSEVDTLAAYVKALGGKLKIVADFGDQSYVLG
ncbi:hypothetical protein [Streptomyces sp. 11x1]|uniref:hypothetical protein n=1 Tax=Streptomyces sp. 11x1 TaxID=3038642 RepID=UPI00293096BA|nr:hypothetical protein [Streptomyces sp. 11x1]WNZ11744.1 hypothetical protein P8T65_32145 [Streptomyces sp. 11x1]